MTKMASAYGMDFRNRVMADVQAGMSAEKASEKYSVSPRTVYNRKALLTEKGTVDPRDGKPWQKPKLQEHRDRMLAVVEENSGITLEELRERLQLPVCLSTVWLALKTWGIVLKKSDPRRTVSLTGTEAA
jgi:transposase